MNVIFQNNKFETHLFFKPLHSGTIIPFHSNVPKYVLKGIVLGEIRRAVCRSSNNIFILKSLKLVFQRFVNNHYSFIFLHSCFSKFLIRFLSPSIKMPHRSFIYIKMPFINDLYVFRLQSILKSLNLHDKVRFYFSSAPSLSTVFKPTKEILRCETNCNFCSLSEKENICLTKNVIYKIRCHQCDLLYIGETKRCLKHRISEHFTKTSSAVYKHHLEFHNDHNIYDNFSFDVLHANILNDSKRFILESMYINKYHNLLINGCEGLRTHIRI